MRDMSNNFKRYEHSKILKQTYVCPICFKKQEVETEIIGATEDDDTRVHHVEYNAYCRDCDSYMFDCDNKLVDVIVALNKLGLTTEYCCIGHSKHEEFYVCVDMDCCMPYVSFEKDISRVISKVKKTELYDKYIYIENLPGTNRTIIRARVFDESGRSIFELSDDTDENGNNVPVSQESIEQSGNVLLSFLWNIVAIQKEGQ